MKNNGTNSSVAEGSRKVVLTKWMLVIFTLGTFGYFVLLGLKGDSPPDSFFMNFVLGLSTIGSAFTIGNIFEHREKTAQLKVKQGVSNNANEENSEEE
ncbi:MAG: hypothetical protein Q9M50_07450 [Methylococcales bacterium]|nr:hypothetical protein [Methylococcales bacterium]